MNRCRLSALLVCTALLGEPVSAATIVYTASSPGGNSWRYDYAVANDGLGASIAEFTIYFDLGDYAELAAATAPAGWDALVVQPDPDLPDAGFFDALALDAGIPPDGGLSGFSVTFTFLGVGTPGMQPFDVVNPETFATLERGTTTALPLPGSAWLIGVTVAAAAARARKRATGA